MAIFMVERFLVSHSQLHSIRYLITFVDEKVIVYPMNNKLVYESSISKELLFKHYTVVKIS